MKHKGGMKGARGAMDETQGGNEGGSQFLTYFSPQKFEYSITSLCLTRSGMESWLGCSRSLKFSSSVRLVASPTCLYAPSRLVQDQRRGNLREGKNWHN